MELLYSVLGKNRYDVVYFSSQECEGKSNEILTVLSSHFYKKCKEQEGKTVKLTYFISEEIENDVEENLQKDIDRKDWDKFIIPSFGYFSGHGSSTPIPKYNTTYSYLNFIILLKIIKDILDNRESLEAVKIDISTGWNFYVVALLEALRTASVFWKLYNFTNSNIPNKFNMLFSDPIVGELSKKRVEFYIYEEDVKVKVWFDIPLKFIDKETRNKLKNAGLEERDINMLERAIFVFKAIKENAPLLIYTFGYDKERDITNFMKNYLQKLMNKYKPKTKPENPFNYNMPSRETIETIKAVILTLALYRNIAYILEKKDIPFDGRKWVKVKELKEKFAEDRGIYRKYELVPNKIMLDRDIENLKELGKKLKEGEEKSISEIQNGIRSNCHVGNDDKRNFLAHSGFEYKITKLKKENNELYIGYCNSIARYKSVIMEFLK